jgi:transposase
MESPAESHPDIAFPVDLQAAYAMIVAERQARIAAEAEALLAKAKASSTEATIAHLKLMIEKLKRELYGRARSGRCG